MTDLVTTTDNPLAVILSDPDKYYCQLCFVELSDDNACDDSAWDGICEPCVEANKK